MGLLMTTRIEVSRGIPGTTVKDVLDAISWLAQEYGMPLESRISFGAKFQSDGYSMRAVWNDDSED